MCGVSLQQVQALSQKPVSGPSLWLKRRTGGDFHQHSKRGVTRGDCQFLRGEAGHPLPFSPFAFVLQRPGPSQLHPEQKLPFIWVARRRQCWHPSRTEVSNEKKEDCVLESPTPSIHHCRETWAKGGPCDTSPRHSTHDFLFFIGGRKKIPAVVSRVAMR